MPEEKLGTTRRSFRVEGVDRIILEAIYVKNDVKTIEEKIDYLKGRLGNPSTDMDLREPARALKAYEFLFKRRFIEDL